MTEVLVRSATPSDKHAMDAVSALATETLRQTYRPNASALASKAALTPVLDRLVACIGEEIVGVVDFRFDGDRLCFLNLGVHPTNRRQGIGRAIVEALVRIARERGTGVLSLWTVRETGNEGVFERMGFRTVATEPSMFFESDRGTALTEVRMERRV